MGFAPGLAVVGLAVIGIINVAPVGAEHVHQAWSVFGHRMALILSVFKDNDPIGAIVEDAAVDPGIGIAVLALFHAVEGVGAVVSAQQPDLFSVVRVTGIRCRDEEGLSFPVRGPHGPVAWPWTKFPVAEHALIAVVVQIVRMPGVLVLRVLARGGVSQGLGALLVLPGRDGILRPPHVLVMLGCPRHGRAKAEK